MKITIDSKQLDLAIIKAETSMVNKIVHYLMMEAKAYAIKNDLTPMSPEYYKGLGFFEACDVLTKFYQDMYTEMSRDGLLKGGNNEDG
jgi:hypothetical protein